MSDLLNEKVIDLQELSVEASLDESAALGLIKKTGTGRKATYKVTESGMAHVKALMASKGVTPEMAKKMSLPEFFKAIFGDTTL